MPQPHIDPSHQLLYSGYTYREIELDLYGWRDSDGVEVCDVALVGDKRSLVELVPREALMAMTEFVERQDAAARREAKNEGRAEVARLDEGRL